MICSNLQTNHKVFFFIKWLSFRGLGNIILVVSQAKMAILLLRKTVIERFWEMSNPIGEPSRQQDRAK